MQFKRMRLLLLGLALFAGTTLLHLVGNAPTPDEGPDAYAAADDLEGPGTVPIAIEGPGRLPASAEASATSPSAKPAAAQNPTRHPTPNPVPVRDGTSAPPPSQISSTYLDPFRGKLGNNNGGKTHDAGGSAGQPTSPAAARAQVRKALRARAKAMAGGGGGGGGAWEKEFTKAAKEKATADRNAAKRTAAESFFYSDHSDHSTSMIGQLTKPNLGGGAALSDGAWRERALPKNADPEAMPKNANVVVVAWSEVFHETRAAQANLAVAPAINWFVTWSGKQRIARVYYVIRLFMLHCLHCALPVGDRFVVPSKMRLSLMSFAVAYPTATISIYTNNEPSSAMEELRKADLLTPIPGAGSLLSWAGGNGRLRIVPYKLRNLVSDCAKEVGIPDDETLSRRLRSPFFLKYTSEADLVRSCVTYLIGGIYFDTDVIWLQPWPVEWLEQPTIVVDAASTLSEVQPGTLEYTKWGAEFVDLKGWSVRHAAGTAATAELITDGVRADFVYGCKESSSSDVDGLRASA
jgi:hypothetical protein